MPGPKRNRRERTDEWSQIKQWTLWSEQEWYEAIRPLVLFHETAGERAKEIDVPRRTLARKADEFEKLGMQSLFPSGEQGGARETGKTLPPEIHQLIVDLYTELPSMSWREMAEVCYVRYGRRPHHKHVKRIATSGPPPSLQTRRYQPWHLIADPAERKLAVVRLHSEGWSVTSIAQYMQVSRPTIYATLQRWTEEGVAGLDEKSRARKGPRKVTLNIANEVRKLQENPLLGKWRMSAALARMGIEVSPTTCGRIMQANRQLYGLEKPQRSQREKLEMPFKAVRRHQFWSADIRYIEEHLLPDPKPVYVITVFENFSRSVLASAISPTQNQWDFLAVLASAIRRYGAPEALVTDGGGQFYSSQALQFYDMLGIRKERIEPGEPWQNYAETLLYVIWNTRSWYNSNNGMVLLSTQRHRESEGVQMFSSTNPDTIEWFRYPFVAAHDLAKAWLTAETLLGLAPNTLDAYARGLDDFLGFCQRADISPATATRADLARYVGDLRGRPRSQANLCTPDLTPSTGLSNATLQQRLTSVRLFFDFLIEEGKRADHPVGRGRYTPGKAFGADRERALVPRFQTLPWIPSDEQWRAFLAVVKQAPLRTRCMAALAYDAGLRREELYSLRSDDLDPAHRMIHVRAEVAKGSRERVVPYSETSGELLRAYLAHRRTLAQTRGLLFLSESPRNFAQPITLWTWSKVVRQLLLQADLPHFSTHTFRHLCLTDPARSGWELHQIAQLAGHRNPATTLLYIHLSGHDLAEQLTRGMSHIHAWRVQSLASAFADDRIPSEEAQQEFKEHGE